MVSWSTINIIFPFLFYPFVRARYSALSTNSKTTIDSTSIKYNIPPNTHLQSFFTRRYNLISGSMLLKCL